MFYIIITYYIGKKTVDGISIFKRAISFIIIKMLGSLQSIRQPYSIAHPLKNGSSSSLRGYVIGCGSFPLVFHP